ncbi:zinc finger, CCHC-type containing protein [Tanacetum coccineum]
MDCRVKKNNAGNTFGLGQGSKDPNSSQGLNFDFDVIPFNHYVSHIYEICYVQNDAFAWWIDSGVTCHACKDRCWFETFHPVQDGSILHIGDESTKPIFGRGNVVLEFSSRKTITLVNVVYVSGLRKNLMSGPVLNKYGYKQVYESDKYILSRHGVFVGFGYYNNDMFMLNLNKVPNTFSSVCMISSKDVDSSMWHARLGHVHYKRMLAMSKDNLILEFNITLEKEDPRTFDEAMKSHDVAFWKEAINDEMDSIMENNTRILSDLPPSTYNPVIHQMDVKTTFLNGDLEENVYMKQPEGFIMPRNKHKADQVQVDKTKEFLLSNFSMKDMGEADVIFGIRTKHEEKVSTPLDLAIKLMPNTGRAVDQLEYSRVIGCLMYAMTSTRPDIAYAVGKLSWYTSNPSTHHWHAIIRVFKYLKKTMDYGLYYVGFPSVLEGYFDATFKKQTCITDSTMEAEFVALAAAGKEAKNLIYEIPLWPKLISPISIHYNSATTVAKAYCQIYNEKSRHLGVTYIMVRELITNEVIFVDFVRSQQNMADHLAKGLARDLVHKSAIWMGLKSIKISNDETPNSLLANTRS